MIGMHWCKKWGNWKCTTNFSMVQGLWVGRFRIFFLVARHGSKTRSGVCLGQCWKFGSYVSTLPRQRWVVRALSWFLEDAQRDQMIQNLCRHKQIGNWWHCAHDKCFWRNQFDDFISSIERWWGWNVNIVRSTSLRPYFGMQVCLIRFCFAAKMKLCVLCFRWMELLCGAS